MNNSTKNIFDILFADLEEERLYVDESTTAREIWLMGLEKEVDIQERIQWGGINYDDWDDFNYWEEKETTIPWKGNGD